MAAAASSSSPASANRRVDLDPNSSLLDPPQCSLWFDPKEWSRRYEDTFFTAEIVPSHTTLHPASHLPLFEVSVKAGENSWVLHRTLQEFEGMARALSGELAAHKHSFVVPSLPAQGWGGALGELLSSGGDSAEALAQKGAALNSWLHALLGGAARKICLFPSVRSFLDLDRQLLVKKVESDHEEEEEQAVEAKD